MLNCLADEDSIEWVAVMCLECGEVCDSSFVYDERLKTVLLTLRYQPWMRWLGKSELTKAVLCCCLPKCSDAHVNRLCILNCGPDNRRDTAIARDVPQKDVSIEQQTHYSKSRSTSSGSGSSKSSGTTNAPAARPKGRGRRTRSTGRISATGRSSAVTTNVSPSRTRWRMPSGSRLTSSTVTFIRAV